MMDGWIYDDVLKRFQILVSNHLDDTQEVSSFMTLSLSIFLSLSEYKWTVEGGDDGTRGGNYLPLHIDLQEECEYLGTVGR